MLRHAVHGTDKVDTLRSLAGFTLLILGVGGGVASTISGTLANVGVYAVLAAGGVYLLGKGAWDDAEKSLADRDRSITERDRTIADLTTRLDHYLDTDPAILIHHAGEDPHTTPWFNVLTEVGSGKVLHARRSADNWFTHVEFVNEPKYPDSRSIAEGVTANLEWYSEGELVLAYPGRWAENPEQASGRDRRPQKRIDIPPDGQPVSLDVTIRNPAAYAVFGYNDDSLRHERGYNDAFALGPGVYALTVTLRGVRLPPKAFRFEVEVRGPQEPVLIRSANPA